MEVKGFMRGGEIESALKKGSLDIGRRDVVRCRSVRDAGVCGGAGRAGL